MLPKIKNSHSLEYATPNLPMQLMTIGYEGSPTDQFFAELVKNRVQTLVDIRELPISRKPDFSKNALKQTASTHNINYIHIVELGCPKPIRHEYRATGDWATYTRQFKSYLKSQTGKLKELAELASQERCCLLCFEADPNFCHRTYVAEAVVKLRPKTAIVHLNISS
jgi:uncharacterized protein (DUF488 family)